MGADSLCIKDMAGLLAPDDAAALVGRLKRELSIPVGVHTHFTSGMAYMTLLRAIDAGVDIIDTCLAPFALRTSHAARRADRRRARRPPARHRPRRRAPARSSASTSRRSRRSTASSSTTPRCRSSTPACCRTRFRAACSATWWPSCARPTRWTGCRRSTRNCRARGASWATRRSSRPTSQIVGTQAVLNVLFGRYKMISNEVKDYVYGLYGKPPAADRPRGADAGAGRLRARQRADHRPRRRPAGAGAGQGGGGHEGARARHRRRPLLRALPHHRACAS